MNAIQVKILSGYAAPKSLEFDESQGEIRIGRAPEAEVRLDPSGDTAASRGVHARLLRAEDGGWELECLHASGVGIVGAGEKVVRRLGEGERTAISSGMTFEIGAGGPHLRAEDPNASLVPTEIDEVGAPVAHVPRDVIGKARSSSKRVKIVAGVGLFAIVAVTVSVVAVNRTGQQRTAQAKEEALEQIAGVHEEAARGLSELRELTTAQASAHKGDIADVKGEIARVEEQAVDRMDTVLAEAAESVWLVGFEDASGRFTPVGTGWTVADRMLATNAHVVEALGNGVRNVIGARMIARNGERRLTLSNPDQLHPAYARWSGHAGPFAHQFRALAGGAASKIELIPPCDVALLRVADGDPGEPLALGGERGDGDSASQGMVVGYAGYPMENMAGLPALQVVVGRITAVTDYFFGEDPEGENLLIHYDAATVGGASGSPLLNNRGEVVGLVSAGSVAQLSAGGGRVPVGFDYAQSTVLVQELLDGTAESMQRLRDERWRQRLSEVSLSPNELADRLISDLAGSAGITPVGETTVALDATGVQNAATVRFRMEPGYEYVIVAVSDDWTDIDLHVQADDQLLGKDEAYDWYPVVALSPVDVAAEALIHIVASPPLRSEECNVTLRVARLNDSE